MLCLLYFSLLCLYTAASPLPKPDPDANPIDISKNYEYTRNKEYSAIVFPNHIDYNKLFGSNEGRKKDTSSFCPYWAILGECQTNPDYMLSSCEHSCTTVNPNDGGPQEETAEQESNRTVDGRRDLITLYPQTKSTEMSENIVIQDNSHKDTHGQSRGGPQKAMGHEGTEEVQEREQKSIDDQIKGFEEYRKILEKEITAEKHKSSETRQESTDELSRRIEESSQSIEESFPSTEESSQSMEESFPSTDESSQSIDEEKLQQSYEVPSIQLMPSSSEKVEKPKTLSDILSHVDTAESKNQTKFLNELEDLVRLPLVSITPNQEVVAEEPANISQVPIDSPQALKFQVRVQNSNPLVVTRDPIELTLDDEEDSSSVPEYWPQTPPVYQSNPLSTALKNMRQQEIQQAVGPQQILQNLAPLNDGPASPPGFLVPQPREEQARRLVQVNQLRQKFNLPLIEGVQQPRILFPQFNLTNSHVFRNPVQVAGGPPHSQLPQNYQKQIPQEMVTFANPTPDLSTVIRGPDGRLYGIYPLDNQANYAPELYADSQPPVAQYPQVQPSETIPLPPPKVEVTHVAASIFSPEEIRKFMVELYGEQAKGFVYETPKDSASITVQPLIPTVQQFPRESSDLKLVATKIQSIPTSGIRPINRDKKDAA